LWHEREILRDVAVDVDPKSESCATRRAADAGPEKRSGAHP
jgi:hypothetical protein